MRVWISLVFISSFFASTALASGLGDLRAVAGAQEDAQRSYREETRAFERVKSAIDSGAIKKGMSKQEMGERYGEPVVNIPDTSTGREKWIYKPAKSSFFSGVKAYLYFDKSDKLDEIKIVE